MISMERATSIADGPLTKGEPCRRFAPENIAKGPAFAAKVKRVKALAAYTEIIGPMLELRRQGFTFRRLAETLNSEGHRTRYGSHWDAANVKRVLERYA